MIVLRSRRDPSGEGALVGLLSPLDSSVVRSDGESLGFANVGWVSSKDVVALSSQRLITSGLWFGEHMC